MTYNKENPFARILRGELPCDKVWENDHVLAFRDIGKRAPVHVLIIPKGEYTSLNDFSARASTAEQAALMTAFHHVAESEGVAASGYRVISNVGEDGHQEVMHLHFHLLGGGPVGPMLAK